MTMYHFYICTPLDEIRPMSAPILPRCGDTLEIDGFEITIDKVKWIGNSTTLEPTPMVYVKEQVIFTDQAVGSTQSLAEQILMKNGVDRKIQSIKDYRAATGMGLKEAKDAIDDALAKLQTRPTASAF